MGGREFTTPHGPRVGLQTLTAERRCRIVATGSSTLYGVCVCNAHMQQLTELTTVRRTLIKSFDGRVFIKLKQKTKQLVAFPISDGKTVAGNCGLPDLKI
jgi:hypothetical protein